MRIGIIELLIMLIFLFFSFSAIIGLGFWLYRAGQKDNAKQLTKVSNQLAGLLVAGGADGDYVEVVRDGVTVWFKHEVTGLTEKTRWQLAQVILPPELGQWYVDVYAKTPLFTDLFELKGSQIIVGDAQFDDAFLCKSNQTNLLQALLSDQTIRAQLMQFKDLRITIYDGKLSIRCADTVTVPQIQETQVALATRCALVMQTSSFHALVMQ